MRKADIMASVYQEEQRTVLGFHGCDKELAINILNNPKKHLTPSVNGYDWLGDGVYFWQNDPIRAYEWANQRMHNPNSRIREPFVIGAIIKLGLCLNLSERAATLSLRKSYDELVVDLEAAGLKIDEKYQNKKPDDGGFNLVRYLDCAVINKLIGNAKDAGVCYDTVLGYFQEGEDAYPGAGMKVKTHIQISVINPECIVGYFLPRMTSTN